MSEDDRARWRAFGAEVERLRLNRGLNATQLAKQASVAYQSVVTLEQGGYRQTAGGDWHLPNPKDETLVALARVLGANVDRWFERVGRYDERPQTRRSLRRATGRQSASEQIADLAERVAEVERELRELRGEDDDQPGKGRRRRRAPG